MSQSTQIFEGREVPITSSQAKFMQEVYGGARASLTRDDERFKYRVHIGFLPTQHWIDMLKEIGFGLFRDEPSSTDYAVRWVGVDQPGFEPKVPWQPKNGEKIQCSYPSAPRSESDWIDCWYIGPDRVEHVVRFKEYSELASVQHIRPKPVFVEVELGTLLETYASVNNIDVRTLKVKQ